MERIKEGVLANDNFGFADKRMLKDIGQERGIRDGTVICNNRISFLRSKLIT